jgi:hypothetical protein
MPLMPVVGPLKQFSPGGNRVACAFAAHGNATAKIAAKSNLSFIDILK